MAKAIDITGQRFGRLLVLERAGSHTTPSGNTLARWKCQCDCGNIYYAIGKYLRNGTTKSCGCLKKEKTIERNHNTANDLTNQKFGKLTVLYKTNKTGSGGYAIWHCKCECGNECDVLSSYLKRGHTRSCGCLYKEADKNKIKDLTGQRFGKLIALNPTEERSGSSVIWFCQCDCGNQCKVSSVALTQGQTISCGCFSGSTGEEKIAEILRENNIEFERQKSFNSCRYKDTFAKAKFDFYIPSYNCLIEYDGIQHFYPRNFGGCSKEQALKNFEKVKDHDLYKNKWCKENNIILIRISYKNKDNLTIKDLLP